MKYIVHSQMMTELAPSSPRLVRHAFLCRVWRGVSWLVLPLCYLGALIAPAVVLSIPFQVFHKHGVSPLVYWATTVLMGVFVLWMLYRAASYGFRSFRQRVIHVEAIVLFVALVFAVVAIVWIYPPK